MVQGGLQGGLQGDLREYFREYFRGFFLELSFPMDSGRLSIGLEWSGVVSAEVKEEYMTLQG